MSNIWSKHVVPGESLCGSLFEEFLKEGLLMEKCEDRVKYGLGNAKTDMY